MAMSNNNRAAQALLKSVGADGTHWLIVVRPDDGWAILRDGKRVAVAMGNRASIDSGVRKFLSLTVAGGRSADPKLDAQPESRALAAI